MRQSMAPSVAQKVVLDDDSSDRIEIGGKDHVDFYHSHMSMDDDSVIIKDGEKAD